MSDRDLRPEDKASLTRLERLAREIQQQCGHLRRNGGGDEIRFSFIFLRAFDLEREARRALARYDRNYRIEHNREGAFG